MSRAYQIRVSESRVDTVHVEDGVCAPLELLDILPKEQMAELLATELEKQGFERDGDIMRKVEDDVVIEVNPRLTTSYVGLRRMALSRLTNSIWKAVHGVEVDFQFGNDPVEFSV